MGSVCKHSQIVLRTETLHLQEVKMYHFLPSKQNEPGVGIKGLEKIFKIGLKEYHKLFV
jgi:hypothetical protein